ncbi:hypothetical protein ACPA9J_19475 [Pseudomonas aeruginosa]
MLDDSLFALRHAAAQARHCAAYLRSLNALLPHRPNGRYAQVLSSMLDGPLAKLRARVDQAELDEAIFAEERQSCRIHLTQQVEASGCPAGRPLAPGVAGLDPPVRRSPAGALQPDERGTGCAEPASRPLRRTVQRYRPPGAGGTCPSGWSARFCRQATRLAPCSWPRTKDNFPSRFGACRRCAMARGRRTPTQWASARADAGEPVCWAGSTSPAPARASPTSSATCWTCSAPA